MSDRLTLRDERICPACGKEPYVFSETGRAQMTGGVCINCYRRRLRSEGRIQDDNRRVGKRAEQKRRWDREAAKRRKAANA